ncbi:hypothetical protein EBB07_20220 [Paenibacillaceae bacterium]|nr:hypothetical protein EBB07_20220 [Paenibacillaceae bacterium]
MLPDLPCCVKTFDEVFPTEAVCQTFWNANRWQMDYYCPRCCGAQGWLLSKRGVMQCARQKCRYQVSATAGTILHKTRLPLRTWLRAIVHYAERPLLTVRELAPILKVSVKTAGRVLRKIRMAWQYYKDEFGSEPSSGDRPKEILDQDQDQQQEDYNDPHHEQSQQMSNEHYMLDKRQVSDTHYRSDMRQLSYAHYRSDMTQLSDAHYRSDMTQLSDAHYRSDMTQLSDETHERNADFEGQQRQQDEPGFHAGQFLEQIKQYVERGKRAVSNRFVACTFTCTAAPPIQRIWEEQISSGLGWRTQLDY